MGYLSCNADSAIVTGDPHNCKKPEKTKPNKKPFKITHFSYSDLESATDAFSPDNFLGKGSHGSVFKASLRNPTLLAAVKKTTSPTATVDNEIEILSRLRSPRLVNLLGLSSDSLGRNLIVFEYMPNGSLHDLLHARPKPLLWSTRVRFALQVARAVQHLHSSNPPVIHRDIKSSNVLIDGENNARLGDFGLALRGHVEDVKVKCTPPAGTMGYLDPGYLAPGDLSTKSDVFSFGILLLEILSGRKAIDMRYSPPSVVDWAAPLIRGGEYESICDPRIGPPEDAVVMRRLAVMAARCVRSKAEKRPEMAEVVECLRGVNKRVSSPIWNNLGRRVGMGACNSWQSVRYEPLDESYTTEIVKTTSRVGSRRNRKVSSVPGVETLPREVVRVSDKDQVGRSRSVGSVCEIRLGPLDSNLVGNSSSNSVQSGGVGRRRGGLAVKVPTVRLNKSRSMGVLQSSKLVSNNGLLFVKNPNGKEKEESKLLQ
ncbi:serine/threonine-protein kinase-like protein At3g51990 [Rhododendron vialii]|uniref:serine/threonine-protein kinase-like protein At3g51990 n=1 Tax=Rhododendron vialii TaxID=182163 RepID=UPI00265FC863|nr:serine/threonine-protein kinase-like protein At3g51990 [Rhododendron vialii]